jgi:hypothetical protein
LIQALLAPSPDIVTSRDAIIAVPTIETEETENDNGDT